MCDTVEEENSTNLPNGSGEMAAHINDKGVVNEQSIGRGKEQKQEGEQHEGKCGHNNDHDNLHGGANGNKSTKNTEEDKAESDDDDDDDANNWFDKMQFYKGEFTKLAVSAAPPSSTVTPAANRKVTTPLPKGKE
jgi:hypothetical protein